MVNYFTNSPSQTKKLGELLAKKILSMKPRKTAFVIGLEGDLGGGKTTFLQGFAKGLGIKQKILSPTFLIMRKFKIKNLKFKIFYHIDCYRIKKPKEILDLGFKEIIQNPQNIVAVEWADQIRKIMPKNTIILRFEFVNKKTRKIVVK
jgi:tRNA threonylcarbamoyladenosine biosynthesis protein TsaE